MQEQINSLKIQDSLITLRLWGKLEKGRVADIDFKSIFEELYRRGAYFVMKNTSQLEPEGFEEISLISTNTENVEEQVIKEHLQQSRLFDKDSELHLTKSLLTVLNTIRKDGETVADFQRRMESEISKLLNLEA